jgi:hypothetical protein
MLIVCCCLSSRGSFAIVIAVLGRKMVDEVGDKAEEENLCIEVLYLLQALTRRSCEVKRLLYSLTPSVSRLSAKLPRLLSSLLCDNSK